MLNISIAGSRAIAWALLVGVFGSTLFVFVATYRTGQPFYVMGQPFGLNAKAFEALESDLKNAKETCEKKSAQDAQTLAQANQQIALLQSELSEFRALAQAQKQQSQAAWFLIDDVGFNEDGDKKTWKHPDSELTLALDAVTEDLDVVLRTNLNHPGNRLDFNAQKDTWIIREKAMWNYRIKLIDKPGYNRGRVRFKVERQPKP